MIKAIPMEDWLRGCIYHDGRHGYVTLPTDKVHQIANYIQRTRRSGMDGLIDLEAVEADRKTEPHIVGKHADAIIIDESRLTAKCLNCANGGSYKCSKCDGEMYYKYDKDEPQTDCAWMKGE